MTGYVPEQSVQVSARETKRCDRDTEAVDATKDSECQSESRNTRWKVKGRIGINMWGGSRAVQVTYLKFAVVRSGRKCKADVRSSWNHIG